MLARVQFRALPVDGNTDLSLHTGRGRGGYRERKRGKERGGRGRKRGREREGLIKQTGRMSQQTTPIVTNGFKLNGQ